MPTIYETWEQLDQESLKIAWEKQVDTKGFEIAWRIELRRLAEDAKRELGYVYVFLGGTGRTERQRVREEMDRIEAGMAHRELPNPRLHHLHKFLDALLCTYRQHGRKGEHDTPEFLWAIFFIGVVDRVDPRRENTYTSSPLVLDARRYLVVLRDQVELEVHKLQYEQSSDVLTKPSPKKVSEKSPRDGSRKRSKRYSTPYEGLKRKEDSELDWIIHKARLTPNEKEVAELILKYTEPDGGSLTYAEVGRRLDRNKGQVQKEYRRVVVKLEGVGNKFSSQTHHFTGRNVEEENLIREIDEKNRPNTH